MCRCGVFEGGVDPDGEPDRSIGEIGGLGNELGAVWHIRLKTRFSGPTCYQSCRETGPNKHLL